MNLSVTLLNTAMVTASVPVFAALIRGRSRLLQLAVVTTSLASAAFLFIVYRWVRGGDVDASLPWAYGIVASAVPLLLAGYLLSSVLGREQPEKSFRYLRRTFALLGFLGLAFLFLLRQPSFIAGVDWVGPTGHILLGALGKAYLSFLLIGIVLVGYNLEGTYRVARSQLRQQLRVPFLGLFALLGYLTYVLTTGILYSEIVTQKLVASAGPFILAHLLLAYGILRGCLTDRGAPVSRSVVYSSFSALAAGLYVLAIGGMAQLSTFTGWSPGQVVTLSFLFLVILIAILLLVSNRFQRRVRRFIDRNFYVNRYDYRAQWSRVTETLDQARGRNELLSATASLMGEVFLTERVTIALRSEVDHAIRPVLGHGCEDPKATLLEDTPLHRSLSEERRAMLMDRRPDDFEYIGIYAENGDWLDRTASQVVAPLFFGEELVGLLGMERAHKDDPLGFEDVALLESMARHVSAALRSIELSDALAESREMEVMSQWSNMILHDLKNYLTPLRMIAQNLETHRQKPNIAEVASTDLHRVVGRMESLVRTLSDLRSSREFSRRTVDVNGLVRGVLEDLQLEGREGLRVELRLDSAQGVLGDQDLLRRVIENLLTNAVEAMNGRGTLTISTEPVEGSSGPGVAVSVRDTGPGMSESFLRERLFRPFATTKTHGLGFGLFQCRSIVKAHGGRLQVESNPGAGTVFRLTLPSGGMVAALAQEVPVGAESGGGT